MKELILGGVRSGKSALAERYAAASGLHVEYLATATYDDAEMRERISRHQQDRPATWGLSEAPYRLAEALRLVDGPDRCLLVDCLTLWVSNLLLSNDTELFAQEKEFLLDALPALSARVILVSNEVGQGIVPMGELNRRYGDEMGRLHQELAAACDRVTLCVAGLAQTLKDTNV